MRYLFVILWLLLGLLYYWIWSSNESACCGANGVSGIEQIAPISGNGETQAELNARSNTEVSSSASDTAAINQSRRNAEAEAARLSDAEATEAIAKAEETKEVTSVKTTTATGARKLTFYFPYGSPNSSYSSGTQSDLDDIVAAAKASGKKITVTGHTDSDSSAEFNMRLGKRRADQVRTKLISMGLQASQVVSRSQGETQPIASNSTEEGKQKNRRVELIIE